MTYYLGLISGTSMDGVDVALVDGRTQQFLGGLTRPYDREVQEQLRHLEKQPALLASQYCQLNTLLGRQFAQAALQLLSKQGIHPEQIEALGSHGQTICHNGHAEIPYTLQLGCPHTIAALTEITVVADFRTRDIVMGGQGAPLVPLYHQTLWGHCSDLAIVNIGGIANITLFPKQGEVIGYDMGPGNCLLDAWVLDQWGQAFDDQGRYAAQGQIIPRLLDNLLSESFLNAPYPKSLCKTSFSLPWLKNRLSSTDAPVDVQATLQRFTAEIIANSLQQHSQIRRLALCGGGVHNTGLFQSIQQLLPEITVMSTQDLGIDPDYLEAMTFAWLAQQNLLGTVFDLKSITGSKKPIRLGTVYWK